MKTHIRLQRRGPPGHQGKLFQTKMETSVLIATHINPGIGHTNNPKMISKMITYR